MVKLLLILCLIATAGFGADTDIEVKVQDSFFNYILMLFGSVFREIQEDFFRRVRSIYVSGTLTAMLTLVIFIYAFRKIREGTFEFPKDAYEIGVFLVMVAFVNYCLHNYDNLMRILRYLEIPADTIVRLTIDNINQKISLDDNVQRSIGGKLETLMMTIESTQKIMIGTPKADFFGAAIDIVLKFLLWLVYAWFSFILVVSIAMTYIVTFLQVEFWKMFGVIMIPLIYFKATRGMVIFWVKTIIALSLISAFMSIFAYLAIVSEQAIMKSLGAHYSWELNKEMGLTYPLIGAIVISKIIIITLLKEIPTMINGMLGTQSGGSTGAFANSVAMGSIGAAGAGAGFAAFKGAMRSGKVASGGAKTLGTWAKNQGGTANQLNKDIGGGSAGGSSSATSGGSNIGGNISKKTANVSTGNSNSSIDSNNWKQGLSNIWNGKAYQHKEPPK